MLLFGCAQRYEKYNCTQCKEGDECKNRIAHAAGRLFNKAEREHASNDGQFFGNIVKAEK